MIEITVQMSRSQWRQAIREEILGCDAIDNIRTSRGRFSAYVVFPELFELYQRSLPVNRRYAERHLPEPLNNIPNLWLLGKRDEPVGLVFRQARSQHLNQDAL